jgi:hypothetical protein
MNEIKVDHFFKNVADNSEYSLEEVSKVYRHYRRMIEKDFKKSIIIDLHKLGTFILKPVVATNVWKDFVKNSIHHKHKEKPTEHDLKVNDLLEETIEEIENKLKKLSKYEKHKTVFQRFQEHTSNFRGDYERWLEERVRGGDSKFQDVGLQQLSTKLKLR